RYPGPGAIDESAYVKREDLVARCAPPSRRESARRLGGFTRSPLFRKCSHRTRETAIVFVRGRRFELGIARCCIRVVAVQQLHASFFVALTPVRFGVGRSSVGGNGKEERPCNATQD